MNIQKSFMILILLLLLANNTYQCDNHDHHGHHHHHHHGHDHGHDHSHEHQQQQSEQDLNSTLIQSKHIFTLTPENFDKYLQDNDNVIVLFGTEKKCKPCKELKPLYSQIADEISSNYTGKDQIYKVKMARFDCNLKKSICEKHSIKYYPSLKLYSKKSMRPSTYSGTYTKQSFIFWINQSINFIQKLYNKTQQRKQKYPELKQYDIWNDVITLTETNILNSIDKFDNLLIKFYSPNCGFCQQIAPMYEEIATYYFENNPTITLAEINCETYKKTCMKYPVSKLPTLMFWTKARNQPAVFQQQNKKQNVIKWIEMKTRIIQETVADTNYKEDKHVLILADDDLHRAIKQYGNVLVKFYAPWCKHCTQLALTYIEVATQLAAIKSKIKLSQIDCTINKKTCDQYQIIGFPTTILFSQGRQRNKFVGKKTTLQIMEWLGDNIVRQQGQTLPQDQYEEDVITIQDLQKLEKLQTKDDIIILNNENMQIARMQFLNLVIVFCAPMSKKCKQASPILQQIAHNLKQTNKHVKIGLVDCSNQRLICSKNRIKSYPTMILLSQGRKGIQFGQSQFKKGQINSWIQNNILKEKVIEESQQQQQFSEL